MDPQPATDVRPAIPANAPGSTPGRDRGSVTVGTQQVPIRLVVLIAGIVIWLGGALIATGAGGLRAFWAAMMFLVPLVVIGSLTRTISLTTIGRFVLLGGFLMSVAYVCAWLFHLVQPDLDSPSRNILMPIVEEILKFAPLLWIVMRRRGAAWSLGATDFLLIGAAVATGFGVVETAYYCSASGCSGQLSLLPVADVGNGGHLDAGHEIWGAIVGAMMGLALVTTRSRRMVWMVGLSGIAWTTLDHVFNNYRIGRQGLLVTLMTRLTANGWLSLVFFVCLVGTVIAVDWWVAHTYTPRIPALEALPAGGGSSLASGWRFRLGKRALANTIYKGRRAPGERRPEAVDAATAVLARMFFGQAVPPAEIGAEPATEGVAS